MNQEREAVALEPGDLEWLDCTRKEMWGNDHDAAFEHNARIDRIILALRSGGEGWRLAIADIAAERRRQVEVEGWTPEHDDEHTDGALAMAAACYAVSNNRLAVSGPFKGSTPVGGLSGWSRIWPWAAKWWKPADPRRNLVRAAALIVAEIERLDRASPSTHGDGA